jgi:hypothetical protein
VIRRPEDNDFPGLGVTEERVSPGMTWQEYRRQRPVADALAGRE